MYVPHLVSNKFIAALSLVVALTAMPLAFAAASVSISVQSLSPSTSISVGTTLTFSVSVSGFTNPIYAITDAASGSSVGSGTISAAGVVTWTPVSTDVGTHMLTIIVSDSSGNSASAQEQISVGATPAVLIQSVSPNTTIMPGTAVTFAAVTTGFTNPSYAVSDAFNGSSITNGSIGSNGNFSWTPGANQSGSHVITVIVTDVMGHRATATQNITVGSAPSAVIQSLSPSSSVTAGQTVTFGVAASGFSNPTYSLSDSFSGSSISNSNINSSGNFSWTPLSNQNGAHVITVTVIDGGGHLATVSQTISVSGGTAATIQGLSPGSSVVIGNPVTFTVAASGLSNPAFSLQDSFAGTSLTNANINSAGYFSWTPNSNDVGTHNLTLYANGNSGLSSTVTLALTVQTPNIAITSISPGSMVIYNSPLTFTLSAAGFTNPTYTVSDSFSGTSITNSNITNSGYFSWTPASSQSGSHAITVYATDSVGHSANTAITVNVNSGVSISVSSPFPNTSVTAGTAVSFQAYAYGFTNQSYTLKDSLSGSSITNASINASGSFNWVPTSSDVGAHVITIAANDSYGHTSSAQVTITVASSAGATSSSSSTLSTLQAQLAQLQAKLLVAKTGGSSAHYEFISYLHAGMSNDEVLHLQTLLYSQGFLSAQPNGYYGVGTRAAVKKFQVAHGLNQLGVVGPATRDALNALETSGSVSGVSSTTPSGYVFTELLKLGSVGSEVTELQKKLTSLGMYSGPINGSYGALTRAAVIRFQKSRGIRAVGYVGPGTRSELNQ